MTMSPRCAALADELGIPAELLAARGLCEYEEAPELELAEVGDDGREHRLTPSAAAAWRAMKQAAAADGVSIALASAFRSIERQAEIVRAKLARGDSVEQILAVSAPPGFSEHHTGRAIDVATPGSAALEPEFERSAAYAWLARNAARFGFRLSYARGNPLGYDYEPWHWCFESA
jgi:D-alanyl-D-alanine carboxypeptidase